MMKQDICGNSTGGKPADNSLNILFTCVGRRVGLIREFQNAAKGLGLDCRTVGTEINSLSPALYACDEGVLTPPIHDPHYIPKLLELVERHRIGLVVPTIDTELHVLAEHREQFEARGARVLVSRPEVVAACQDKRQAYRFLKESGFATPETWELSTVRPETLVYPVFLKPWDGSASRGNAVVRTAEEFRFHSPRIPNCLVQQFIQGQEYTCDVFVDFQMRVRTVVPRRRIEVRAGEVSKSQTAKIPALMDVCRRVVETLKAGPGVVTIQCFITDTREIKIIEINPRFGGGAPLSIRAGADFPRWILAELTGIKCDVPFDAWTDALCMLRYDEGMWIEATRLIPRGRVEV